MKVCWRVVKRVEMLGIIVEFDESQQRNAKINWKSPENDAKSIGEDEMSWVISVVICGVKIVSTAENKGVISDPKLSSFNSNNSLNCESEVKSCDFRVVDRSCWNLASIVDPCWSCASFASIWTLSWTLTWICVETAVLVKFNFSKNDWSLWSVLVKVLYRKVNM